MQIVTVTRELIEQGSGFSPKTLYFVDCDGYAFNSYPSLSEAHNKKAFVERMLGNGYTPRDIYNGYCKI